MTNALRRISFLTVLLIGLGLGVNVTGMAKTAPPSESDISNVIALETAVEGILQQHQTPAMAIGMIENGETVWLKTFGKANLAENIIADESTLFRIGSVSKMFVALSVLQLIEQGKLDLQDKLTDLAPEIVFDNPWQASHPIRLVHLLEHTTGWSDMKLAEFSYPVTDGLTLAQALMIFPDTRTSRWVPGTRHAYSNVGSAVVARIIEKITGQTYEDYVQQNWFDRLDMPSATFFQPEKNTLATAYMQQQAQPYWDILYRPAGAINSTAKEMLNLVSFLLQRGQFNQQVLLAKPSIDRMEIPKSNLGAVQGITHGYGLANYTSGFHHTTFHGHDGGVIGATSQLAYAPKLQSGFVILTTGVTPAQHLVGEKIKQYLTRNLQALIQEKSQISHDFSKLNGYYKSVNLRNSASALMADTFLIKKVSVDTNTFKTEPLITGYPSSAYQLNVGEMPNNSVLVDEWVGLPAVAVVNDPLLGKALQVGSELLVKESAWVFGSKLSIFVVTLLTMIVTLFYGFFWSLKQWRKKYLQPYQLTIRQWPTYTALALFIYILTGTALAAVAGLDAVSQVGVVSVLIYLTSLLYPLIAIIACYKLLTSWQSNRIYWGYWVALSVSIVHILAIILLLNYGQIAVRTWLM